MIDTHQHLLYPDRFRYPWLSNVSALSGKAFTLDEYWRLAQNNGISETVFMEVDAAPEHSLEEARFFCELAEIPGNRILGVIAACRPESDGFEDHLDALTHPAIKGLRRILHNQRDELSQSALFRKNVALLGERGLPFDMCFLARQLPLAIELADACPGTRLMLDHCGGPDIAGGHFAEWAVPLSKLALRRNVFCKLSGLVTCATKETANTHQLRPWVEHVYHCFGADRIAWGGDWPVCNLTSSLPDWIAIAQELASGWSESERERVFHSNAIQFYGLVPRRL